MRKTSAGRSSIVKKRDFLSFYTVICASDLLDNNLKQRANLASLIIDFPVIINLSNFRIFISYLNQFIQSG